MTTYEWTNLFLCCQLCNQRHKGNLFPLTDAAQRALDHHADLDKEQPLLVRPDADPERHIEFRSEEVVGTTVAGCHTVDCLQLNRSVLREKRLASLTPVRLVRQMLRQLEGRDEITNEESQWIEEAQRHLSVHLGPDAEYAGMMRHFLGVR